jgi:flagellar protein FlgJ
VFKERQMVDNVLLKSSILDSRIMKKSEMMTNKLSESSFSKDLNDEITKTKPIDEKLMNTCIEMESLFVAKMFKEMRNSVEKSDWLHGGFAEEVFQDMLYDEYSLMVSKNSNLGLAKMLYDEMSRR